MKILKVLTIVLFPLLILGCNGSSEEEEDTPIIPTTEEPIDSSQVEINPQFPDDTEVVEVPYTELDGNTVTIPITIDGLSLDMIYDTGASDTQITFKEAQHLLDNGKLKYEDLIGFSRYQIANGQIIVGLRVNLKEVTISDKIYLRNIKAVIIQDDRSPLLLGQSIMRQFRESGIDRENKVVKFVQQLN